jgi:hypothetical protein
MVSPCNRFSVDTCNIVDRVTTTTGRGRGGRASDVTYRDEQR